MSKWVDKLLKSIRNKNDEDMSDDEILDLMWIDMDTTKGRWYAKNAPRELILSARKRAKSKYQGITDKEDKIDKIHEETFRIVDKEGDNKEWKNKWGHS